MTADSHYHLSGEVGWWYTTEAWKIRNEAVHGTITQTLENESNALCPVVEEAYRDRHYLPHHSQHFFALSIDSRMEQEIADIKAWLRYVNRLIQKEKQHSN
jgi:hypothetical protein